ncbi:unnamed protein product [Linum tenue]|uniref:Uncharacterized protein n=1 Tax=Linum tenue TaxID=586396 RepID=A0AAV0MPT4_9ROSI|nr:unnamed protein product [Linum tenue]CAI0448220.1 unnamed protein product [Linum tenue]CAI0448242.1 unnamed protein product [Linum tenue]
MVTTEKKMVTTEKNGYCGGGDEAHMREARDLHPCERTSLRQGNVVRGSLRPRHHRRPPLLGLPR